MPRFDAANYTREELLRAANASPEAVAKHDKQSWFSLFSEHRVIEDPVGTAPHRRGEVSSKAKGNNDAPLDRFYETFIAPNDIVFHSHCDIVAANMVVRDVDIEVASFTGLVTGVHSYLMYEMIEEEGQLKIARMAAYWELPGMVKQVMRQLWPGFRMMVSLSLRMIRIQGLKGIMGYMHGFSSIGQKGKKTVLKFVDAVNSQDTNSLTCLFDAANIGIEFPADGQVFAPSSFVEAVNGQISVSDLISAGSVTAFRFDINAGKFAHHGIGFFEFNSKTHGITNARFFQDVHRD